jgi:hypothetical protein
MWTLYDRHANTSSIDPDPFVFTGTMQQHSFFSSQAHTCVLWCVKDTNICLGASVLDSDTWMDLSIEGQWRVVEGGRLTLLASATKLTQQHISAGPQWFIDLCTKR